MQTKNNNRKWRPGSNAAFGRNNGVPNLMLPSAAIMGVPDLMRPSAANGVQGLMRPSAAKCQQKKIDNVVNFFSLTFCGRRPH